MKTFASTLTAVAALSFSFELPAAEPATVPDPAAHTVIVPYDGRRPVDSTQATRFYLDYAEFQRLWNLAKESRRPVVEVDDNSKPEVFINSGLYDATIHDDHIEVSARLSVITKGKWARLDLLAAPRADKPADLPAGEIIMDGLPMAPDKGGVLVEKPGAHLLEWKYSVPVSRGWRQHELLFPKAASSVLRIDAPLTEGAPTFILSELPQNAALPSQLMLTSVEVLPTAQVVSVPLGERTSATVVREPLRQLAAGLPASVDSTLSIMVEERQELFSAGMAYQFPGVMKDRFSLRMDETLTLRFLNPPGLKHMQVRKEGGLRLIDVTLIRPVADKFFMEVGASRVFAEATGPRTLPIIIGEGARISSKGAFFAAPELQVQPQASAGVQRTEWRGPPPFVERARPMGAYMLREGQPFPYEVSRVEAPSFVQAETVYQLSAQKAEIISAITLDAGRVGLTDAKIGVPQGYEVQTLVGPGVSSWHRSGAEVFIRFDQAARQQAKLVLHLAKSLEVPAAAWVLKPLKFPGFKKDNTTVLIAAHAADDVKLTFDASDRKIVEIDPAATKSVMSVTPPLVIKRALKVEKEDWTAQVALARQPSKFSVDAVLLAQATDEALSLSQQVGLVIEQGAVSGVTLTLPKDLPEARVHGPMIRDVQSKVTGDLREYEVKFQQEIADMVSFTLEMELSLEGEKALPVVNVNGASRMRRFTIVDNAGNREMKVAADGTTPTSRASIPYLPQALHSPQFYQAGDQSAVKLSFMQLESTTGNAAIITLADITTALRPNGERWDTVVYSLANRSLQFLPVRLPKSASLVEVSVGGQTVRADKVTGQENGKGDVLLIPLIQMRAGELSQEVRLVYKLTAPKDSAVGTHTFDDPELVGLSAERTLWNVWVPRDHTMKKWDGNMEEIVEEVQESEKQESLLSDLSRLNRVLSSKDLSYQDAEAASRNAGAVLEKLKTTQSNKFNKFKTRSSGYQASEDGVEKKIQQQEIILTENRINQPLFATQAEKPSPSVGDTSLESQKWNANSVVVSKGQAAAVAQNVQGINDNITLEGSFLVEDAPKPAKEDVVDKLRSLDARKKGAAANGLEQMEGAKNSLQQQTDKLNSQFNNSRALQNAQQKGSLELAERETTARAPQQLRDEAKPGSSPAPSDPFGAPPLASAPGAGNALGLPATPAPMESDDVLGGGVISGGFGTVRSGSVAITPDSIDGFINYGSPITLSGAQKDAAPQLAQQLKPVGRVSLAVTVPLQGTVHHFRKIKDHARIDMKVTRPWADNQKVALGVLLAGGLLLFAIGLLRRKTPVTSPDLKAQPIAP